MSRFTDWSKMAVASTTIWTKPQPVVRIVVRLMAAIAGQHTVLIAPGEPAAATAINRTHIRFPNPLDDSGAPTEACRTFVIETIREAILRDHYLRWIQWPDGTTTTFTSKDRIPETSPSSVPVPKSALLIQREVVDRSNVIEIPTRH